MASKNKRLVPPLISNSKLGFLCAKQTVRKISEPGSCLNSTNTILNVITTTSIFSVNPTLLPISSTITSWLTETNEASFSHGNYTKTVYFLKFYFKTPLFEHASHIHTSKCSFKLDT